MLFEAAHFGHLEQLQEMIDAGVDVHLVDSLNSTALHAAAHRLDSEQSEDLIVGAAECVQMLLDAGVVIDSRNINQATPLMQAAATGQISVLEVLIRNNAQFNLKTKHDRTALHYAARYGHAEAVQRLLDAGADWSSLDDRGKMPEEVALNDEIRLMIQQHRTNAAREDLAGSIGDFPVGKRHTP